MYNLPNREKPEFKVGEYNCATFSEVLNVPILADTGMLAEYILVIRLKGARTWTPNNVNR